MPIQLQPLILMCARTENRMQQGWGTFTGSAPFGGRSFTTPTLSSNSGRSPGVAPAHGLRRPVAAFLGRTVLQNPDPSLLPAAVPTAEPGLRTPYASRGSEPVGAPWNLDRGRDAFHRVPLLSTGRTHANGDDMDSQGRPDFPVFDVEPSSAIRRNPGWSGIHPYPFQSAGRPPDDLKNPVCRHRVSRGLPFQPRPGGACRPPN